MRPTAVVGLFLIGCAVLMVAGCAGVRSGASQEEEQGRTEAAEREQARSPEATASEEGRCGGTRPVNLQGHTYTTNDVSGCPNKGGLLSGTDKADKLDGEDGDDEIRGLGANDDLIGGLGSDVIFGGPGRDQMFGEEGDDVLYGGDGDDEVLSGDGGEDVIYGGEGNDILDGRKIWNKGHPVNDAQRDKLYCGEGRDAYVADKLDYVDSSCETNIAMPHGGRA